MYIANLRGSKVPLFLISNELNFPKTLKSFAQAFSKACRVEGRSPSWVLRATPLTFLAPLGANFVRP